MRLRPPPWLKRLLLPAWNGAHRIVRRCALVVRAIHARRIERCSCCGRVGPMLFEPGIIPPKLISLWELTPELAQAFARKESLSCGWCGAKQRARRMAEVMIRIYPTHPPVRSLAQWITRPEIAKLTIAEINIIDGLHGILCKHPRMLASDFQIGAEPGEVVNSVRHEDLCALTYDSESFDLVLTSETLEHVPDLSAALGQIRRVLKPGGRHLFTIPTHPAVSRTYARAVVNSIGEVEHRATPIHHPGGDIGYPVFTEFGEDFIYLLNFMGFETNIHFGPVRDHDIAQVYESIKQQ